MSFLRPGFDSGCNQDVYAPCVFHFDMIPPRPTIPHLISIVVEFQMKVGHENQQNGHVIRIAL